MYVWMYTLLCLLSNCRCNPSCCQSETCRTPKDYCGTRLVWLGVSVVLRIRLMLPVGSVCGQATNPETPSSWGLNSLKSLSKLVRIGTVAVWSSTPALHRKRPTVVCTSWCPEMFPNCKKKHIKSINNQCFPKFGCLHFIHNFVSGERIRIFWNSTATTQT